MICIQIYALQIFNWQISQLMLNKKRLQYLVGQRIKLIREDMKIEQQELAARCDMDASNLSRIEYGNTSPTMWTLYKISAALKVNLKTIFDFDELVSEEE